VAAGVSASEGPRRTEDNTATIASLIAGYRGDGPLEQAFYLSPEVFAADIERIWRRHWLYAGHACAGYYALSASV
jgi:hypothetical protein